MSADDPAAPLVAVVAMACRVPGATTPEQFFQNLCDGIESIVPASEWREARPRAVPAAQRAPGRAVGVLHDLDLLDAGYFGLTPREAEVMDPQQRLFLECCAEALQRAGHDVGAEAPPGAPRVGVYAGMGINTYFLRHVLPNAAAMQGAGAFQAVASNEKDFIATQTSYRLGLTGPSLSIHTACSTSLVAIAQACEALLAHQCDVALAGGSSVKPDPSFGFFLEEGGIASPDGVCRAFDARANGTVGGMGVGVVALKRLEDALADGDHVHAVVRGAAVNNDGAAKAGYTAPSVEGQAAVIAESQAVAGVDPATIGFVEAHGTGTPVGDPIEVAALTRVFRASTEARGYCALGAVKTNIGHLDAAAGVAGFIKAVMALERRVIPPTLHFERPNPALKLDETPFYVNARAVPFEPRGGVRRAAVSSFGIGGTNAHVVLEEAPPRDVPREAPDARPQLLLLSARTPTALEQAARDLADHLARGGTNVADAAWTLQTGRRRLAHRKAVLVAPGEDAAAALRGEGAAARRTWAAATEARERDVAFLFPGQGAQHVGMGRGLYDTEPAFRDAVDDCARRLERHLGLDVRALLYPEDARRDEAAALLAETRYTQPALFVVEYATARLWMSWGVRPRALLGHSIGEYVAACLADVMDLDDALALVAERGRLMHATPEGAMVAVALPEADVAPLLPFGCSVAAVNGPGTCVVAGAPDAVRALTETLRARGIDARPVAVERAFHSPLLDGVLDEFEARVAKTPLRAPRIPVVSNVTGTWLTAEEATSPRYWRRHLRETVRFADGLTTLLRDPALALLECGPGRTLTSLATRQATTAGMRGAPLVATMGHAQDASARDELTAREALARLWLAGAVVDWGGVHAPRAPRKAQLPAYPFERRRHWLPALGLPAAATPARATPTAPAPAEPESPSPAPEAPHARPALATPYVAPRDELEEHLVTLWEDLFGFRGVGVEDDFFDLGGHSLLATRLVARLRETYDVDVQLTRLFDTRTIAQLARVVEERLVAKVEAMTEDEVERALRD